MVKIKNLGLTKTKFAREKYRKFKRRYKLNNTIRNRSIMIDDEKGYKKSIKFTVKKFQMIYKMPQEIIPNISGKY